MTQRRQTQQVSGPPSTEEWFLGHIKEITVKNFMCHSSLTFKFSSGVNFIVGRNGSGKSAVMAAITLALGGRASSTSRAATNKAFIKHGEISAVVRIVLANCGDNPFKPDVYGDEVIVERHLNQASSSYKIKTSANRVVSTYRKDLDVILDHMEIQADNPVTMLNQDTSKNFLNTTNSKKKYEFFERATYLDVMLINYSHCRENYEQTKQIIVDKKEVHHGLEKELEQLALLLERSQNIQNQRRKVDKLKKKFRLALIKKKFQAMKTAQEDCNRAEQKRTEIQGFLDKSQEKAEQLREDMDRLRTEFSQGANDSRVNYDRYKQAKTALDDQDRKLSASKSSLKQLLTSVRDKEREKDIVVKRLQELRESSSANDRVSVERRMQALRLEIDDIEKDLATKEHDVEQFTSYVHRLMSERDQMRVKMREYNDELKRAADRIQLLQRSKNDTFVKFGEHIPRLRHRIEWALAIEQCTKGELFSFCCHDFHDERELMRLFDECVPKGKPRPSIMTAPFSSQVYDVSRNRPDSNYPTVLEMIQSANPVAVNALIDSRGIESVLLIDEEQEGCDYMRKPPRGCREAFAKNGTQICVDAMAFRVYSCMFDRARWITADVEADVRALQARVSEIQRHLAEAKTNVETHTQEMNSNESIRRSYEEKSKQLRQLANSKKRSMDECQQLLQETSDDYVQNLETDIARVDEVIDSLKDQVKEAKEQCNQDMITVEQSKQQYQREHETYQEAFGIGDRLKNQISELQLELNTVQGRVKATESKVAQLDQLIASRKRVFDEKQQLFSEESSKHPGIDFQSIDDEAPDTIRMRYEELETRIIEIEAEQGDLVLVQKKHDETNNLKEVLRGELEEQQEYLEKLEASLTMRRRKFKEMRKTVSGKCKEAFSEMLGCLGFQGTLKFDHDERTLEFLLQKEGSEAANFNLKDLSGGERSFATVAFLVSLWKTIEAPFRCLDEFDVFMDVVNRRRAMEYMLDAAAIQKQTQFIFLTPLDISYVSRAASMSVYRMPDPPRNAAENRPPEAQE